MVVTIVKKFLINQTELAKNPDGTTGDGISAGRSQLIDVIADGVVTMNWKV
jgi:hypothetical protein